MPSPLAYPKDARLRLAGAFRAVLDHGEVFPGRVALVRRLVRDTGGARLGVSVPKGYGSAPRRNRFRRLAREAFRARRAAWAPMDLFVSPRRGGGEPTLAGIAADLERAARAPRRPDAAPRP